MNQSGWSEKNCFPVPQYKWREAEDRAARNAQLLSLTEQHVAALKKWALEFIMNPNDSYARERLMQLIGLPTSTERRR